MGHIDVSGVGFSLSDGRVLLNDVSFRVDVEHLQLPNHIDRHSVPHSVRYQFDYYDFRFLAS
jgi:hypothetical protein